MINSKTGARELAYVVRVDEVSPIEEADRIALAHVGGWRIIIKKGEFVAGDLAVFFEIDSHLPQEERYEFLAQKHYNVKTMKLNKFGVISQGLLMPLSEFPELQGVAEGDGLTEKLHITYAVAEDNKRKKEDPNAKYVSMKARHRKIFSNKYVKKLMKYKWFRELMFVFFGKKKDKPKGFPTKFPGVSKTDQDRCENLPWVLGSGPYIVTQKCDGSSATYILEKLKNGKYEFYVCSRNVRMLNDDQECFFGNHNYYWECAFKYNIQEKMKDYLDVSGADWVCWQGEICAPSIQKNPHGLTETHLFLFHFTDSIDGRIDIREAVKCWKSYDMEVVPIVATGTILPDNYPDLKALAEGFYHPSVCEGKETQPREGYVYYSENDPRCSFKNVSNSYLLAHNG